jgi:hypothetical protein
MSPTPQQVPLVVRKPYNNLHFLKAAKGLTPREPRT